MAALRSKGQAYDNTDNVEGIARLIRSSSGYGPLPGAGNQVVLSDADLDVIERQPGGLAVTCTDGPSGWMIRMEATR